MELPFLLSSRGLNPRYWPSPRIAQSAAPVRIAGTSNDRNTDDLLKSCVARKANKIMLNNCVISIRDVPGSGLQLVLRAAQPKKQSIRVKPRGHTIRPFQSEIAQTSKEMLVNRPIKK